MKTAFNNGYGYFDSYRVSPLTREKAQVIINKIGHEIKITTNSNEWIKREILRIEIAFCRIKLTLASAPKDTWSRDFVTLLYPVTNEVHCRFGLSSITMQKMVEHLNNDYQILIKALESSKDKEVNLLGLYNKVNKVNKGSRGKYNNNLKNLFNKGTRKNYKPDTKLKKGITWANNKGQALVQSSKDKEVNKGSRGKYNNNLKSLFNKGTRKNYKSDRNNVVVPISAKEMAAKAAINRYEKSNGPKIAEYQAKQELIGRLEVLYNRKRQPKPFGLASLPLITLRQMYNNQKKLLNKDTRKIYQPVRNNLSV